MKNFKDLVVKIKKKMLDNKVFSFTCILILLLGVISVPRIFAQLQPVKSIEIFSEKLDYNKKESGAWKIKKSAKWVSKGTAEITFDLDTVLKSKYKYTDVLFVLDNSASMEGNKIARVKEDTRELVNTLLSKDGNNVGLITFNDTSSIISSFTNNQEELLEEVNSITVTGDTNYYQALVNVDTVLKEYEPGDDRGCVVLFLTDGYPNRDIPNEVVEYNYLKATYPFVMINGVQYEMGNNILTPIKNITDNQFVAGMSNLSNVLFEAALLPVSYDKFEIQDYVNTDYFYIDDDISNDKGIASFDESTQKIIWNLDGFMSGLKSKMSFKVKLKDEFIGADGIYSTNEKEIISSKIKKFEEEKESFSTPVLADNYRIIYDANEPSGCRVNGVPETKSHSVFDTVGISSNIPKCEGYQFKGWKMTSTNVTMINDDYFIMPESDVTLKANWSKLDITKSMSGQVKDTITLYDQVKADVDIKDKNARTYTGSTSTFNGSEKVYYYGSSARNNNVIFADFCWKIVRTTDTGGVKLVYNGLPDENGKCKNINSSSDLTAASIGSYKYNENTNSPADVGYMYNTRYVKKEKQLSYESTVLWSSKFYSSDKFYYSDNYNYVDGKYKLLDYSYIDGGTDYEKLIGKYVIYRYTSESWLWYVVDADEAYIYYIRLHSGNSLSDLGYEETITFANEFVDNSDGTATLVNPITIEKKDWRNDNTKYVNYYTCGSNEITCSSNSMRYVTVSDTLSMNYVNIDATYKYGNSFTWNGNVYTLSDTKDVLDWDKDWESLKDYHYTCFNSEGVCSTLYYIFFARNKVAYYIELNDGKSVEDALNEMLYNDDVNTYESTAKKTLDSWYTNNMTEYTSYLEDTVWCNDRSTKDLGGWNPNGGALYIANRNYSFLRFTNSNNSLTCKNMNDRFTVDKANGNGMLVYPIGMLTSAEVELTESIRYTTTTCWQGSSFYSLSPDGFIYDESEIEGFQYSDSYNSISGTCSGVTNSAILLRPAISLKAGIKYYAGDGSVDNPYLIDASSIGYKINIEDKVNVSSNFSRIGEGGIVTLSYNSEDYEIESFKVNGRVVSGTKFAMPGEDVTITDVVRKQVRFDVIVDGNDDIIPSESRVKVGENVTLMSKSNNWYLVSFKMNDVLVKGNSFVMPDKDVIISDIDVEPAIIFESTHIPYSNNLNDVNEKTFEGATSLTVNLDYQTESTSYDWVYLYDGNGKQYGKYGGTTRKAETITIPGNYIKVVFRTDGSQCNYYGYKATIIPNYD